MFQRTLPTLLALSLLLAACSGGGAEPPVVAHPTLEETTTTSTLAPTTTTTTIPIEIEAAPSELAALVEAFYAYSTGVSPTVPAAPEPLIASIAPSEAEPPTSGKASLGTFKGEQVAVVEMDPDIFLAVDDGSGWRIVGGAWPSLSVPAYFGGAPRLVAVVGSDARPGQTVDRSRADSIHFVALDGVGGGAVVGLPRDSYISIPGVGRRKATSSLATGGPERMMATFTDLTGLAFEGYVLTGFAGFQSLVGTVLGGVSVDIPSAINDRWAHVALKAGEQLLNGAQALGFARARKTVPGGDLTRSEHQGVILIAAAEAVKEMGYGAIPGLMELSEPHLLTDLTPEQLLTFSAMAISADLDSLSNVVAPGRTGTAGGASVVFLADSVSQLWDDLADGHLEG
jgi:LCP family protein required for cell wall assembly